MLAVPTAKLYRNPAITRSLSPGGTGKRRGGEGHAHCGHMRPTRNLLLGCLLVYGRVLANNLDGHGQVVLLVRTPQHLSIRARAQLLRDEVPALWKLLVLVHAVADEPGKHARLLLGGMAHRLRARCGQPPIHTEGRCLL